MKNMDEETFKKEISLCRELARKNDGKCAWGECDKCGVVPLLFKIGKGEFYEKAEEVKKLKEENLF